MRALFAREAASPSSGEVGNQELVIIRSFVAETQENSPLVLVLDGSENSADIVREILPVVIRRVSLVPRSRRC